MTNKRRFNCINLLFIFSVIILTINHVSSDCQDWEPYKTEKCYKIFKEQSHDFDAAKKLCKENKNSSLVIIETEDDQKFLYRFVFDNNKVLENVWIGLRRNKITGQYQWVDNTSLKYANWERGNPTEKAGWDCVEMIPNNNGTWLNFDCKKKNVVVCQRMPEMTVSEMQMVMLRMEKKLKDYEDRQQKMQNEQIKMENKTNLELNQLKNQQTQLKTDQNKANTELNQLKTEQSKANKEVNQLKELQTNFSNIPVGFVYVQLPNQPEPKSIFLNTQWTDISSQYANMFFRTVGSLSAPFGQVQEDASPRITSVFTSCTDCGGDTRVKIFDANKNGKNLTLSQVYSGSYGGSNQANYALRFDVSVAEVRPVNMAVKIWKRVK